MALVKHSGRLRRLKRTCKTLISAFVCLYDLVVSLCIHIASARRTANWIVLYYHSISPDQRERFGRQMDALVSRAEPIRLDVPVRFVRGRRYVSVSFDDGFVSYVENALPELAKRNIPSTVFVPTGWIGKQAQWKVNQGSGGSLERVLDGEELRILGANSLVCIGSHCVSHRDLCLLEDDEAGDEIVRSKEALQTLTGREVGLLSFPFGSFRDSHAAAARLAGYRRVFSIMPSPARGTDEFVLGRTSVDPEDSMTEFRMKLAGAYRWLPAAFALKARLRSIFS